jgi:hypothetical protein
VEQSLKYIFINIITFFLGGGGEFITIVSFLLYLQIIIKIHGQLSGKINCTKNVIPLDMQTEMSRN